MNEVMEIKHRIEALQAENKALRKENESMRDFVDLFLAYEAEGSAIHRASKLVDLKMAARKLKR